MLTLYTAKGSCSLASHIALEDAGADYQVNLVDLAAGAQQSPDYLKINPKGRVPALATDEGILTESLAILLYIAQTHPAANLAPLDDPFELARIQAFNSYLASTVQVAHAHGRRASRWADDEAAIAEMKRKMPQVMTACFEMIETEFFKGPWGMGETYTIADPYLFTIARWLEGDTVDPKQFTKVYDHRCRMAERETVKKVLASYGG